MKRNPSNHGFTLIEILIVSLLGGLLLVGGFQIVTYLSEASQASNAATIAHEYLEEISKTLRVDFSRRYWAFQSPIVGVSLTPLTGGTPAFRPNPGAADSFKCTVPPDLSSPSCQNMRLIQIATAGTGGVADTFRSVDYQTTCQGNPDLVPPPDFNPVSYSADGSSCPTAPALTLTTAPFPADGTTTSTRVFTGDKVIGSAICFRPCIVVPDAGIDKPAVIEYAAELAVIFRGRKGRWEVLKSNLTLSSGDFARGAQILPH